MRTLALTLTVFVFTSFLWAAPLTFEGAFQAALTKESAGLRKIDVEVAEEKQSQAFGNILPKLTLNGAYTRQDSPTTSPVGNQLKPDQWYARLSVAQPIFHGLSEFAAYRSLSAKHRSAEASEIANRLTLYGSVASAFYGLLGAEKDLEDVRVLWDLTSKRVKDIKERVRIGRSRKGDLLSAESQSLTLNAQVASSTLQLQQAREQFKLVTGLEPEALQDDEKGVNNLKLPLADLLKELDGRPDIRAAKEEYEAADEMVSAAFGYHLPQIDFAGNYYLARHGALDNVKWDLGVIAIVPLFNGGATQSAVRENIEVRKSRELQLAYARRNAEKELKTSYQSYLSLLEQSETYEKAYQLAEANYQEQNKDYRYGLVTNLDVLTAMNALQETKRNKDKTFYLAKAAYRQLLAATGKIP